MRSVCLIFQVHLPVVLNRYRFFEIGEHHPYLDVSVTGSRLKTASQELLLPLNQMLLRQINTHNGKFRVAFYISGITLEQFRSHIPELFELYQALAATGNAEFMTGTYSFSLASLYHEDAFAGQVTDHRTLMGEFGGNHSDVFYNTGLIYNDKIGEKAADMGFKGIVAEGAGHILGWRSPGKVYFNAREPGLKILFRHPERGNDLQSSLAASVLNSGQPSPEKFIGRLNPADGENEIVNLIVDLAPLCSLLGKKNGITGFLDHFLFLALKSRDIRFVTPTDITGDFPADSPVSSVNTVSMNSDGSYEPEWIQNELQQEALSGLYAMTPEILQSHTPEIHKEWNNLQCAEHFRRMEIRDPDAELPTHGHPPESPFEAFINYMNVLNDFKIKPDQTPER